jgi:hypothetical protein
MMCNLNLYFNNHNDYKIDYVYCCAMGAYTTYHGSVHETSDRWVYYLQNSSSVLSHTLSQVFILPDDLQLESYWLHVDNSLSACLPKNQM